MGERSLNKHQKFPPSYHYISHSGVELKNFVKVLEVMENEINRLNSFKDKWPLDFISINDLAKCGFFYLLYDDKVQCAFCRIIIAKWKRGDKPLDEHRKFSSKCHFVSYFAETVRKAKEIFPSPLVEVVIKHLKKTGKNFSSLEDLCDKILEYEEKKLNLSLSDTPTECEQFTGLCLTKTRNKDFKSSKDVLLCKICFVKEMGITFQPCGHLLSCDLCSHQISKCPICRLPVQKRIKTYLS